MNVFTKLCFCHSQNVPFRSSRDFDAHVIARVYCPTCVDRSPAEALLLRVSGTHGRDGVYGIDWNQGYLLEKDPGFRDEEPYYKSLVESGGVVSNFVPEGALRSVSVIGIKAYLPAEEEAVPKRPRKAEKARKKP